MSVVYTVVFLCSNPAVQKDIHSFGGLQLLCTLISPTQPDLVQRRALFALGALLRGNPTHQEQFVDSCRGVHILGGTFAERSARVKAKAVTLVMDIINEQVSKRIWGGGGHSILGSNSA